MMSITTPRIIHVVSPDFISRFYGTMVTLAKWRRASKSILGIIDVSPRVSQPRCNRRRTLQGR